MQTRFLLAALAPIAIFALPSSAQPSPDPNRFDVKSFFAGRTEGRGVLDPLVGAKRAIHVQGTGRLGPDGTLILDQVVEREGQTSMRRQWRIREVAQGRYSGTLTDAQGPVTGTLNGNRLELRYRLKEGDLKAEQVLQLQPDGRTVLNRMKFEKFGIQVANLEETIRKLD